MKSECSHIRQLLSEYIDGVLDAAKMTAVREHLHICEACSREYEALNILTSKLGNFGLVEAPDNFLENFHSRIESNSIFGRLREIFSFTRIRIPVELAAFATTAILILFLFHFFPVEEKGIIKNLGNENIQLAMDEESLPDQTIENLIPAEQTSKSLSSLTKSQKQQIPIKLALLLTTQQEATPIPSQSVSFGNSGSGYTTDDLYTWQPATGSDSTIRLIRPDEVNVKIDEIITFTEGKLLSRNDNPETGLPTGLKLEIPVSNYHLFISNLDTLGVLQAPAPILPEGSEDADLLIQIEFISQQ